MQMAQISSMVPSTVLIAVVIRSGTVGRVYEGAAPGVAVAAALVVLVVELL